jgi:hypothetical protein
METTVHVVMTEVFQVTRIRFRFYDKFQYPAEKGLHRRSLFAVN